MITLCLEDIDCTSTQRTATRRVFCFTPKKKKKQKNCHKYHRPKAAPAAWRRLWRFVAPRCDDDDGS